MKEKCPLHNIEDCPYCSKWCEHNRNIAGVYTKCEVCHSSPQPEKWESGFDNLWGKYQDGDYRCEPLYPAEDFKSFIKIEIRKAEERKCQEIVESFQRMQERYQEFCLDLELFEGDILVNTTRYGRKPLEALKK